MFLKPNESIIQFFLKDGMRVADFGAGTGAFTKAISEQVGYTGTVYAIEIQKDLLARLESDLKEKRISNVVYVWGDVEKRGGTKIPDRSVDAVVISNILFQAQDKLGLIDEAKRILKSDGKVLVIDWKESFASMGPIKNHIVTKDDALSLFRKRGFAFLEEISTTPHHYGIIFTH